MSHWFELPAGILSEEGVIRVRAPADADPEQLRHAIMAGTFGKPFVLDDGRLRYLYFNLRFLQSAMRIKTPDALELGYTRHMMAVLLFNASPKRLLLVGLGGGSLVRFCRRQLPRAMMTAVEIDPAIIALSSQFGLEEDERLSIVQADAADYLPQAEADTDVLLLDAFDREGISGSLARPAFFEAARRRLKPQGILVTNLAGAPGTWEPLLALIGDAFEGRVITLRVGNGENHIAFAFKDPAFSPHWTLLEKEAKGLQRRHGLDFPDFLKKLKRAGGR